MNDQVTWLREQLDEDERNISHALAIEEHGVSEYDLVDIDVKRQILYDISDYAANTEAWAAGSPETDGLAMRVLDLLALRYADRPGYDEAWRPPGGSAL